MEAQLSELERKKKFWIENPMETWKNNCLWGKRWIHALWLAVLYEGISDPLIAFLCDGISAKSLAREVDISKGAAQSMLEWLRANRDLYREKVSREYIYRTTETGRRILRTKGLIEE